MINTWVVIVVIVVSTNFMLIAGYLLGKRRAQQEAQEPICGCGHHRAFHEGVARCRAWVRSQGHCECQNYIGPEPMPKFLMPHMTEEVDK